MIHFLGTRVDKIARIAELQCHVFIDDLAEVLLDPGLFPETRPIWFAGAKPEGEGRGLPALSELGRDRARTLVHR